MRLHKKLLRFYLKKKKLPKEFFPLFNLILELGWRIGEISLLQKSSSFLRDIISVDGSPSPSP